MDATRSSEKDATDDWTYSTDRLSVPMQKEKSWIKNYYSGCEEKYPAVLNSFQEIPF